MFQSFPEIPENLGEGLPENLAVAAGGMGLMLR